MRRVKVTLPPAATDFGVAIGGATGGLGLALGLYTTVEFLERKDDLLQVEATGELAAQYPFSLRHPAVVGMSRVFQYAERALLGVTVRVESAAPAALNLGLESSLYAAGVIGANNLLGSVNPLRREAAIAMAARAGNSATHTLTSIYGGLNAVLSSPSASPALPAARSLPVAALKVVLVLPQAPPSASGQPPPDPRSTQVRVALNTSLADAQHNLSRLPFLLDALRTGDTDLLTHALDDRLLLSKNTPYGYEIAADVAAAFALTARCALTPVGRGGALMLFAEREHARLAEALTNAYEDAGMRARTWVVPVDTQGVVVSLAQSA